MKYSISFNPLPFEPEIDQVIYVENIYDERINILIKKNYKHIKWLFKRVNLEFIYFPLFFNDEETKEKIMYYAPYLTTEGVDNIELRSSYLLDYMSHVENRENVPSSFIYFPKYEHYEWTFQGLSIDKDLTEDTTDFIEWIEKIIFEIDEEVASVKHTPDFVYGMCENDESSLCCDEGIAAQSSCPEFSSTPNFYERFSRNIKKKLPEEIKESGKTESDTKFSSTSLDEIYNDDIKNTVEELENNIKRLRLRGVPLSAIVELVSKYETVSRLRITDDLKILLPDYNNIEVTMPALYKAVYFLFINHPEGIILQQLENCHHEFVNYYQQTSHKKEITAQMIQTINNLEYPGNNNINTILSKIKTCFRLVIDERLAKNYYIVGNPGEPYKIALDNNLIEWEDE